MKDKNKNVIKIRDFLSEAHCATLNLLFEKNEHCISKIKDLDKDIINRKYRIQILNYEIKETNNSINELNNQKVLLIQKQKEAKEKYKEYAKSLMQEYNIKDESWGYDPDSGKIIAKEKQ